MANVRRRNKVEIILMKQLRFYHTIIPLIGISIFLSCNGDRPKKFDKNTCNAKEGLQNEQKIIGEHGLKRLDKKRNKTLTID